MTASKEGESLAGKWAAKEAFIKAWSGLRAKAGTPEPAVQDLPSVYPQVVVEKNVWGVPSIRLLGEVEEQFSLQFPHADISLSISHDGDIAGAVVQIIAQHSPEQTPLVQPL